MLIVKFNVTAAAYLYVLNDLRIKRVIIGIGWDFCCAVFEQIFLPEIRKKHKKYVRTQQIQFLKFDIFLKVG